MADTFVAVDWGTSRFRAWLLDCGVVAAERRTDDGMLACARENRFAETLDAALHALAAPKDAPVLIAGMAGARGGWREAPYAVAPARLEDVAAAAAIVATPDGRDVRILPGVSRAAPDADVMRGEETQLFGLALSAAPPAQVCIPGTHSKWARLQDGSVERFQTYMTGDLFSALGRATALAPVLEGGTVDPSGAPFLEAVRAAWAGAALSATLFSVRARSVLGAGADADAAASRLSGLLIGAEIADALDRAPPDQPVALLAAGGLDETYRAAFDAVGVAVVGHDAEAASRAGLQAAASLIWPRV